MPAEMCKLRSELLLKISVAFLESARKIMSRVVISEMLKLFPYVKREKFNCNVMTANISFNIFKIIMPDRFLLK